MCASIDIAMERVGLGGATLFGNGRWDIYRDQASLILDPKDIDAIVGHQGDWTDGSAVVLFLLAAAAASMQG